MARTPIPAEILSAAHLHGLQVQVGRNQSQLADQAEGALVKMRRNDKAAQLLDPTFYLLQGKIQGVHK